MQGHRDLGLLLLSFVLGNAGLDADRGKTARGDAERQRCRVFVTPPDGQHFTSGDFFYEPVAQEFADGLFGGAAFVIGRRFYRTLRVLCGGGKQHELRIGEFAF